MPPLPDLRDLLAPPAEQDGAQGMATGPDSGSDTAGDPAPGVAALLPALAVCDLMPAAAPLPAVLLSALTAAAGRALCGRGLADQHAGGQGGLQPARHAAPAMLRGAADMDVDTGTSAAGQLAVAAGAAERSAGGLPGRPAAAGSSDKRCLGGPAALAAIGKACMSGGVGTPALAPCAAWTPRLAAQVLALLLRAGAPAVLETLQGSDLTEGPRHALLQLLREAVHAQMSRVPARLAHALACADALDAAALLAAVRPLQVPFTMCIIGFLEPSMQNRRQITCCDACNVRRCSPWRSRPRTQACLGITQAPIQQPLWPAGSLRAPRRWQHWRPCCTRATRAATAMMAWALAHGCARPRGQRPCM